MVGENAMEETAPDLLGLAETLRQHERAGTVVFAIYEILSSAEYTDEEILEVSEALGNIVS
jgi:hypothetical protein